MDSGDEKRNQDNKRRRLQLLASEKKLLDKFPEGCLHGPSRHDLNRILTALEFGPTTKKAARLTPPVSSMRCRVQMRVLMMKMQKWSAGE